MSVGAVSNIVVQLAPSHVDGHVDAIRDAFRRGVFTDYQTGLAKKSEWAELLNNISIGRYNSEEKLPVFILYLFTVTIDPKYTDQQRKAIVEKELSGLSEEDRDIFYKNFDYQYPPLMATHFLRYGALWWRTCQRDFHSTRADWVIEVIGNQWPYETKKEFVEQLFLSGGANRDRILECIIYRASDEELQAFGRVSNPSHVTRLQDLSGNLLGLCKYPYSDKEVQFIKWFKRKALEHPDASVAVAHFNGNDWRQLEGTPKLTSLVVKWMSEIGSHPKRPQHLRQFYHNGSKAINEAVITEEEYGKLAQLTLKHLVSYFDEFKPAVQNAVIQRILRDEPQKLVEWLELILAWSDKVVYRSSTVSNRTALGKIIGLFALIERNGLLPRALSLVFNPQTRPALALTVYSALDTDSRRKILTHLRENTPDWVGTLAEWKRLCATPESDLRAFVRDEFARDLSDRLVEVDTAAVSERVDVMRKLVAHFQNPATTPHERSHFLRGIRAELVKEENWLSKLIQEIPQPLLPFLYLYFAEDMFGSDYYKCEKPKEGEPSTFPPSFSSVDEWVDFNVNMLMQMVNNPYFPAEKDKGEKEIHYAIDILYHVAMKHRIFVPVLQKFIEKVPPEQFVQTLNRFPTYHFFAEEVFTALENSNINKLNYLGDCLESASARVDHNHATQYQDRFWCTLFLKREENCRVVANRLIAPMGIKFLERFYEDLPQIVMSLKDDPQCEQHFFQWVEMLCQANLHESTSLRIFQWICLSYSKAGFDVIGLLDREEIKKLLPTLRSWHRDWALQNSFYPWPLALSVLRKLNPKSFYPTIFYKISCLSFSFSYPYLADFNGLLNALNDMGCAEEFMAKLPEEKEAVKAIKCELQDNRLEEFKKIAGSLGVQLLGNYA